MQYTLIELRDDLVETWGKTNKVRNKFVSRTKRVKFASDKDKIFFNRSFNKSISDIFIIIEKFYMRSRKRMGPLA